MYVQVYDYDCAETANFKSSFIFVITLRALMDLRVSLDQEAPLEDLELLEKW